MTRGLFILSTRSASPLVGVCMESEGCCELPGNSLFPPVGRKPAQFPSGPFVFSQQPSNPWVWSAGKAGSALQTGRQSPLRFQQRGERSYELMVCAQHGWQGSLHEFLKQFSAKTAPSTTWNSIFQGKRAAWCGLLISSPATCSHSSFGQVNSGLHQRLLGYTRAGLGP